MTEPTPGKVTNPGWPDPTDWVNRLYRQLAGRQAIYDAEPDPLLKRNKAGAVLADVLRALMEFPPFQQQPVHFPLKDLMHLLADLDQGRDHIWATPVNVGGTSITNTADGELRSWVKAVFTVLRANNFRTVEAYKHIAMGLTKNGRSGRKNTDPVRWRTVGEWCRSESNSRDDIVARRMDHWWTEFKLGIQDVTLVDSWGDPVSDPDKKIAGRFSDMCWELQHLRDRSIS